MTDTIIGMTPLVVPDEGVQVRGLRSDEFLELVERGLFADEPIELLGGELVVMSPQGPDHHNSVEELNSQLAPLMIQGYGVRVQCSLLVDELSIPEPDVVVVTRSRKDWPSEVHCVIEVSVSSLRYDLRHKTPRYAAAGFPMTIVMDMVGERAIVHTDPGPDGYATVEEHTEGTEITILGQPLDLDALFRRWSDEDSE